MGTTIVLAKILVNSENLGSDGLDVESCGGEVVNLLDVEFLSRCCL